MRGRSVLALVAAALLILWLGNATDIDLLLADAAYDARLQAFPWRASWLADTFSHVLLKRLLVMFGAAMIGMALWDWLRPQAWSAARRHGMRVVALSALLVPAATALLKQASSSHCPWDIDRYGGVAPYVRLLQAMPASVAPGHCLPGGHASSALWMISLAILLLPGRPRLAAAAFGVLLSFGLAVGWLQQLRGAHFLTHTLWSAWVACAVVAGLHWLLQPELGIARFPRVQYRRPFF